MRSFFLSCLGRRETERYKEREKKREKERDSSLHHVKQGHWTMKAIYVASQWDKFSFLQIGLQGPNKANQVCTLAWHLQCFRPHPFLCTNGDLISVCSGNDSLWSSVLTTCSPKAKETIVSSAENCKVDSNIKHKAHIPKWDQKESYSSRFQRRGDITMIPHP